MARKTAGPGESPLDELPIGQVGQRFRGHLPRQVAEVGAQVRRDHFCASQ